MLAMARNFATCVSGAAHECLAAKQPLGSRVFKWRFRFINGKENGLGQEIIQPDAGAQANGHIREFLKYYLDFTRTPRYAVFLDGPWGIGKTFLVRKILNEYFRGWQDQFVWVSLFGLSSKSEIDDAVFASLYPTINSALGTFLGNASSAALQKFGVDFKVSPAAFLSKHSAKVYIFDDLERCEVSATNVLGYINSFVEHAGAKVLIIGDESVVLEKEGIEEGGGGNGKERAKAYRLQREKVIGKTLQIQSAIEDALGHFITQMTDLESRQFISGISAELIRICDQSKMPNLRVVQNSLWDFERFFRCLETRHRDHTEAMLEIVRLFFVLSFEIKLGRINAKDFESRGVRAQAMSSLRQKGEPENRFTILNKPYGETVDLHSEVVSNDVLVDVLIRGVVDQEKIRSVLDTSKYFVSSTSQPAWRIVWNGITQEEDVFESAVLEMERQFQALEFKVPGIILHVVALRLWLTTFGAVNFSRVKVVSQAKSYIDSLFDQGIMGEENFQEDQISLSYGYEGLGYMHGDNSDFVDVFRYLDEKRTLAKVKSYTAQASGLMEVMAASPEEYVKEICYTFSGSGKYKNEPLLVEVDPQKFVALVLSHSPSHQHQILQAFRGRYEGGSFSSVLTAERNWLNRVREEFFRAVPAMSPIGRYRIERAVGWFIDPFLKEEAN